jgi:hypothetical protein
MQVTIEVPDELAHQFGPDRQRIEEAIARLVPRASDSAALEELIDFLARGPQIDEIVKFRASEKSAQRVRTLLDKNREGTLTDAERAELDAMEFLNHLFALIKARALGQLRNPM